jgi:GNAT superfamily N-acetyltransferase
VVVRSATPEDVDAIVAVTNAAFVVEKDFIDGARTDREDVLAHLARGEFLVLEDDAALVGCVFVEHAGGRGYFGMLAVDPARQGGGHGRRLVAAAEDRCRARGCSVLEIRIVSLREELFRYYRALGYAETDETLPFSAEAAHLLKRPCHFVVMRKAL